MLKKAYWTLCLNRVQVYRWHTSFLEGRELVEDEQTSERHSTSKTDVIIFSTKISLIKFSLNVFAGERYVLIRPINLTIELKYNRKVCV